jgi:acetyl esterase
MNNPFFKNKCSFFVKHAWLRGCLLVIAMLMPLVSQAQHEFETHKNITWVELPDMQLTLDIYVPKTGKKNYPVLVIYHGGGWLINNNSIMNSMSEYVASHGEYVVANVNYRLLGDSNNRVHINQIVEDALGALAWVKENIAHYKGDPKRVAVTGDSAGGHLASMVLLSGRNLETDGFAGKTLGFKPTYLPKGKTAERLAKRDALSVQAAVISYAAFDLHKAALNGFESPKNIFWTLGKASPRGLFGNDISVEKNPEFYKAVSSMYNIPAASTYKLPPQFVHVGSTDTTTPPASSQEYVDALKAAGHPVEFKIYPDRNHAFLDNDCNEYLKVCFDRDAPEPLNDIIQFLDKIFWPKN